MAVAPHDYLKIRLDPIGAELDGQGVPHLILALLPGPGAMHVVNNALGQDKIDACERASKVLKDYAEQLKKAPQSSLILPPGYG